MIIEAKFTYYSRYIYIPDGYIHDITKVHCEPFSDWMSTQSDCMIEEPGGGLGFTFDSDDFLRYLNTEVLKEAYEKAYYVEKPDGKSRVAATLYF